jgi:hypothetical protein
MGREQGDTPGAYVEEGSFVAKGAPPSCAKKDVGYGGQAG